MTQVDSVVHTHKWLLVSLGWTATCTARTGVLFTHARSDSIATHLCTHPTRLEVRLITCQYMYAINALPTVRPSDYNHGLADANLMPANRILQQTRQILWGDGQ